MERKSWFDPTAPERLQVGNPLAKGGAFVRYGICKALARGSPSEALLIAEERYRDTPWVAAALRMKAAVSVGTSTDASWAGPLVQLTPMASEYVNFEFGSTILGRLSGKRQVPMNISFPQGGHLAASWIGDGVSIPACQGTFTTGTLGYSMLGAIAVVTKELAEFSSPSAELILRDDLARASIAYQDNQFLSAQSAVSNLSPAGILNGIAPVISGGSTPALLAADFNSALKKITDAGVVLREPFIIMTPATAIYLATLRTTTGDAAFEDIAVNGGTLFGVPVLTSASVSSSVSGGAVIAIIESTEVMFGDNGALIDVSSEASLQMSDAPSAGGQQLVSLFQQNLVGFRLLRFLNWTLRRPGAAAWIDQFMH